MRSFRLARVIRIRHDVSGSCSVHSDVSDLREEMVWSGYQARVGFDASFDASFRAFFRASFRASGRGQMAFEVRKCETTSSARLHFESAKVRDYKRLKVRKCETTSMHRCRRARLFVDFERRGILGDTRTRSRAKSTTEACISLYVKKIRD